MVSGAERASMMAYDVSHILATCPRSRSDPNTKAAPCAPPHAGPAAEAAAGGGFNLSSRIRDFGELPVNYEDAGWR